MDAENIEQKKIGLRIRAARILTGLNQEEFADKCGFNHTSLRNWEFGRVSPRAEAIENFIDALKQFGILTCTEWLINAVGEGPIFINSDNVINDISLKSPIILEFKKMVQRSHGKLITTIVSNDDMKPIFNKNDILCGLYSTINEIEQLPHVNRSVILSNPILIQVANKDFQPRWLNLDDKRWFSRSQSSFCLEPLKSNVIGIINAHFYGRSI